MSATFARSRAPLVRFAILAGALALLAAGCLDFTHNDRLDEPATRALLARPAPFVRADVAVVLGCPADDESGAPSLCQRCRVKTALRAYRRGEVDHVIFSGGAAHNRFVEAESMARLATARGLPAEAIALEPRALTTWMNLRYSRKIMEQRGWRRALIISTAGHLLRVDRFSRVLEIPAIYRACDWDLPHDTDDEWRGPLRP